MGRRRNEGTGRVVTERRIALLGDPVVHSVSPAMQRAAFDAAGLRWRYETVTVPEGRLEDAWHRLRADEDLAGLNVTIPHKERIAPLLDRLEGAAARWRTVNTVAFLGGTSIGLSTDGAGFLAALGAADPSPRTRAVVLGAGGAARAVAAALREKGSAVVVLGRNAGAGGRLAEELGVSFEPWNTADPASLRRALAGADLLVNATPIGTGDPTSCPVPDDVKLEPTVTVVDLVYRPRRTALLRRAQDRGCRTVEGVEMLIEQGALSFQAWTGLAAPLPAMRAAAHVALNGQAG
jgi:shikimate dehydrogenase